MFNNIRFFSALLSTKQKCATFLRNFIDGGHKVETMVKDSNQVFTNADIMTQAIFERSMKTYYPQINIIGEENLKDRKSVELLQKESSMIDYYTHSQQYYHQIENELNEGELGKQGHSLVNKQNNIDLFIKQGKVKILLDPIDATYSFVNKTYNESTILAGVLINNKPFVGTITSPFYNCGSDSDKKTNSLTYFNIPFKGVYALKRNAGLVIGQDLKIVKIKDSKNLKKLSQNTSINKDLSLIVSRTREEKLKSIFMPLLNTNIINKLELKTDNGMGYRSLKMIENGYYYMTVKSSLGFWDLCATDAIFRELGGGCLNLDGKEINYEKAENKDVLKYDVMIGDNYSNLSYYLQHVKLSYGNLEY